MKEQDLGTNGFDLQARGAWLRWVLAFVPNPRDTLARVAAALEPGGRIAIHEYFAYESWNTVPHDPDFGEFVAAVMSSWRSRGGEPNVGLSLVPLLEEMGFEIHSTRTLTDVVDRQRPRWHWPAAFARSGLQRLVDLGDVTPEDGHRMSARIDSLLARGAWMVTPGVIEVIATKGR